MFARKPFAKLARRLGLFVEHLEDRTAPARSISPTEVLAAVTTEMGPRNPALESSPFTRLGIESHRVTPLGHGMVRITTNGDNPESLVTQLQSTPGIAWAQPNYVYESALEYTPNDTKYSSQANLTALRVSQAWDTLIAAGKPLGNSGTSIAVIDEGIDQAHIDFGNSFVTNPGDPDDAFDNDGNGYLNDFIGWDFTGAGDNNPAPATGNFHGNAVAGVIAARTNNAANIAGIAGGKYDADLETQVGGVRILPIRVVDTSTGSLSSATMAAALNYTASRFVRIANISLDLDPLAKDNAVQTAMTNLYNAGTLIIASAGNTGTKDAPRGAFDQILFVGGLNNADKISSTANGSVYSSNYGAYVDIMAPSEGIFSLATPSKTTVAPGLSGTSFAAPQVAGVAALLLAQNPSYTRDQLAAKLLGTAVPIDHLNPGYEGMLGVGRVDALNALTQPLAAPTITDFKIDGVSVADGGTVNGISTITLKVKGVLNPASLTAGAFELRSDGPDNVFGNGDDTVLIPSAIDSYRIGDTSISLTFFGQFKKDHYSFKTVDDSIRDPFDLPISSANVNRTFNVAQERMMSALEITANTFVNYHQANGYSAIDSKGNFVLTWQSDQQDGSGYGIYARFYNYNGEPFSSEFQVNIAAAGNQLHPKVVFLSDGNILFTYEGQDGSAEGIFGRVFSPSGVAVSSEFQINTSVVTNIQNQPDVCALSIGFAVAFRSEESAGGSANILYRIYDKNYLPLFTEKIATATTSGDQTLPKIAFNGSDQIAIGWIDASGIGTDQSNYAGRFRLYSSDGTALTQDIQANLTTSGMQYVSDLAYDSQKRLNIVLGGENVGDVAEGIAIRRFDAAGVAITGEGIIATTKSGKQTNPTIAADANGNIFVAWAGYNASASNFNVYYQSFDSGLNKIGSELVVGAPSTFTMIGLSALNMRSNPSGDQVLTWFSDRSGNALDVSFTRTNAYASAPSIRSGKDTNAIVAGERVVQSVASLVGGFTTPLMATAANPANWQLTIDGLDKSNLISNISYSPTLASSGLYEVTLTLSQPILTGNVTLRAKDTIQDTNGNALDGDANGTFGGDFVRSFTVANIGLRGAQWLVNTTTAGSQSIADVAAAADGRSVAVWQGSGSGDADGVFAQLYDNKGAAVGSEIRVNNTTAGVQAIPRVAIDNAGNFTVAWLTNTGAGVNTAYYRQFTAAGVAVQATDQLVSTAAPGTQQSMDIAMNGAGQFVLAWQDYGADPNGNIFARRFNAGGVPLDPNPFSVNTATTGVQGWASTAMDAAGNFVIVWEDNTIEGNFGIQSRLYRADGTPVGGQIAVNSVTAGNQLTPTVAMDSTGNYVVAWRSDDASSNIKMRYFNSVGVATTAELAGAASGFAEISPFVAMDADGDTTIVWQLGNGSPTNDIQYARFNSAGALVTPTITVGSYTTGGQQRPALALDATGNGVIVWSGEGSEDSDGVFRQRLAGNDALTTTGIPTQNTTEDGSINYFLPGTFSDPNNPTPSFTYSIVGSTAAPGFFKSLSIINDFVFAEPAANATGSAVITVRATIPGGLYADASFALIVQPVNDPPSFVKGNNLVNVINAVPQTIANWATGISGGPGETDAVSFEIVSNSNPSLFSVPPAISANGTLTYTPATGEYGAAVIQVRAKDNGGTANGGVDVSAPQTFTITVDPTNPNNRQFGSESVINTYTTGLQNNQAIAVNSTGMRVVAWSGEGPGDNFGIFAQIVSRDGTLVGGQILVNANTSNEQYQVSVGIADSGSFAIVWSTVVTPNQDSDIYVRTFNQYGVPTSGDILVHSARIDAQGDPKIAMRNDGSFIVVWSSDPSTSPLPAQDGSGTGIYYRTFTADGTPIQPNEQRANVITSNNQSLPDIAVSASGDFAITWTSLISGSSYNIYARRFSANGSAIDSNELLVNTNTVNAVYPRIAMDAAGKFIVAWQATNGANTSSYIRRYMSSGTAIGLPTIVFPTSSSFNNAYFPNVVIDSDGDFAVTATADGFGNNGTYNGYLQRFTRDGATLGNHLRLNSLSYNLTGSSRIESGMDADGDYFATWPAQGPNFNIHGRRHGYPEPTGTTSAAVVNDPDGTIDLGEFFTNTSGPQEALGFLLGGAGAGANNQSLTKKSLSGRTLTFEFATDVYGSAEIPIRVANTTEGTNGEGIITVRKLQTPTNAVPILEFIRNRTINEGSTLSLKAAAVDKQGANNLVYTILNSGPGSIVGATGAYTWTPTDSGTQNVTIRVTDPDNTFYTQETFTVTVANVAPTALLNGPTVVAPNGSPTFEFTGMTDIAADLPSLKYAFDYNNDGVWDAGGATYALAVANAKVTAPGSFFSTAGTVRTVRGRVIDKDGGFTDYFRSVNIENVGGAIVPPTATAKVNDGNSQRSNVTKIAVAFDVPVSFPNGLESAFTLTRAGSAGTVPLNFAFENNVMTITFEAGPFAQTTIAEPSLIDGAYTLTVHAANVQGLAGPMMSNLVLNFKRLFGDVNGDATVDATDFSFFPSFGPALNSPFDFNANGDIDSATDFAQFGNRFGLTL